MKKIFIGLLGVLVAIITFYFMYGWYDVFPWAVAALIIGYTSKSHRDSLINGAIFGYVLFQVYIFAGYKGKTDTTAMFHFILFNLFFSLVGAIAGGVGAFIGYLVKRRFGGK